MDKFICEYCPKKFNTKNNLTRHMNKCSKNIKKILESYKLLEKKLIRFEEKNKIQENEIKFLKEQLLLAQERYEKISLVAVKKSTSTNNSKNIQINQLIQNMEPLRTEDIKNSVEHLTLEHHREGAEGYARFALEIPFKDKIVCVDIARNKFKYKNNDGDVVVDEGFKNMFTKLCKCLKDRSYDLSQEHYETLAKTFTETELDGVNLNTAALAIARYANGRDNKFCNKVIRLIGKGCNPG